MVLFSAEKKQKLSSLLFSEDDELRLSTMSEICFQLMTRMALLIY